MSVFVAGMMLVALILPSLGTAGGADHAVELRRLRRFNLFVPTPALACVWLLGLTLAIEAGWLVTAWLQVKIVLVALLSGIHGLQSSRLRRLAHDTEGRALARWWPLLIAGIAATIMGLASAKPELWQ